MKNYKKTETENEHRTAKENLNPKCRKIGKTEI